MRSGYFGHPYLFEQIYFGTVRGMRKLSGRNAVLGLIGSMMQHAPMNTIIFVCLAALQSLYQQTSTIGTILLIYQQAFNLVDIFNPIGLADVFCSAGLPA